MRNRRGQVVLVQPKAKIDGLIMPRPQRIPKPPQIYLLVGRPLLRWLLQPMKPQRAWADFDSLFDGSKRLREFKEQVRRLANKSGRPSPRTSRKQTV